MAAKKDPEDKKSKKITVRFTEDEYDEFMRYCHSQLKPMATVIDELRERLMARVRKKKSKGR